VRQLAKRGKRARELILAAEITLTVLETEKMMGK